MKFAGLIFLLLFLLSSCRKDQIVEKELAQTFIHIGHTRTNQNGTYDSLVRNIDFSVFDMRFLGGDMAYLSSFNNDELLVLDSMFDISNPNTLWALGNHDVTNPNLITALNNRPTFYAYYKDGISFLVLNNQLDEGELIGEQLTLIETVIDTISESNFLIILSHKLFWMYGNNDLETEISLVSNGGLGDCAYCINPNDFYNNIYPQLVDLEKNNIEVICVAGDIGHKAKKFEYQTMEGIDLIASGIKGNDIGNLALIFKYYQQSKLLLWHFAPLENL